MRKVGSFYKDKYSWGAWLAKAEEHGTADLGVTSSSSMLVIESA